MKKTHILSTLPLTLTLVNMITKDSDKKEEANTESKTPYEIYQSFSQEEKDEFKLGV